MKAALLCAVLLAAATCDAKVVAEAPLDSGAVVLLYDEAGPCEGDALLVEFVAPDGKKTRGCWLDRCDRIGCVFLDGDIGAIPKTALRPPKQV